MLRSKSDDLFQLIKSLNQSEKGYFKKFVPTQSRGEVIYLLLFNAIDKQKVYDEDKVLKRVKSLQPGSLSKYKNYLYNLILRMLDLYHTDSSAEDSILKMLKQVRILFDRGLHEQALTTLTKAKRLATIHEKHLLSGFILSWEIRLAFHLSVDAIPDGLAVWSKQFNLMEQNVKHTMDFILLNAENTRVLRGVGEIVRNKQQLKPWDKFIKSPLLRDERNAQSYFSKCIFYSIHGNYHHIKGNWAKSLKYREKVIRVMESDPEQLNEYMHGYIAWLNNLFYSQFRLKQYAAAKQTLEKQKRIPENYLSGKKENMRAEIFVFYYSNTIDLYNALGQPEKSVALVKAIEEGLTRFEGKILANMLLALYTNVALAYFGNKQFDKSLKWLNKVLHYPDQTVAHDIQSVCKIINLVIHYEMKNYDLLEHLVRSTYRYFLKKDHLFGIEKAILAFIRNKLPITDKEQITAFKKLKKDLEIILKDPFENNVFTYFDLVAWLQSKIEERSFAEVVRERAG